MNAHEARVLLFQRKLAYEDYNETIPGVPELDGQLGILELRASDTVHVGKLAKDENGEKDEALVLGAVVAKALVLRETKERLCSDTDIEAVSNWGMRVLKPLSEKIAKHSGLSPEALAVSKKS
jgi:hypothetical protein